jgi:DNA replication protein DnaC
MTTTPLLQPLPELVPQLKRLRLSGLLESLPLRHRQAVEGQLAYPEFLALLIQDEIARREHKKFTLRVRRAGFRSQKTLSDFDFSYNPGINQAQILDLATCRFVAEKVAVLIAGPCGTGKSHLAQALGHEAARRDYDVLFTTQRRLLATLQLARATHTYERRFQSLARVPLLLIDDFGLKPFEPPGDEDFHELISERYEHAATVVTSNLDFQEWASAFPNRLLGAATLDRLRHGAYTVILEGDSYRSVGAAARTPISPLEQEVEKP